MPKDKKYFPYGAPVPTSVKAHNVFMEDGTSVDNEIASIKESINKLNAPFELLDTVTITEDVYNVTFIPDMPLRECVIKIITPENLTTGSLNLFINNKTGGRVGLLVNQNDNVKKYGTVYLNANNKFLRTFIPGPHQFNNNNVTINTANHGYFPIDNITDIIIEASTSLEFIYTDTVIEFYGIPA